MAAFAALLVPISQTSQSLPAKPAFEVATIKVNTSGERTYGVQYLPGGRFMARNIPLLVFLIVQGAYNVSGTRVIFDPKADPEKVLSLRYDIEAVAEKGTIPSDAS